MNLCELQASQSYLVRTGLKRAKQQMRQTHSYHKLNQSLNKEVKDRKRTSMVIKGVQAVLTGTGTHMHTDGTQQTAQK